MDVSTAARANDDDHALGLTADMHDSLSRFEELSRGLVEAQRHNLELQIQQQEQQAKATIVLLGAFVGVGLIIGIIISLIVAHSKTQPLAVLDLSMAALAKGGRAGGPPGGGRGEIGRTINSMSSMVRDLHA